MWEDALKVIDTKMHGRDAITGCFLVGGERRALIETGPKSSLDHVLAGLDGHGVDTLDWIVVTHIHLDHAGAAGSLAQRFPMAKVVVHERGAKHLVDPSKLWSSAARIYGDQMERLWGGIDPLPEEKIHILRDGEELELGGGRTLRAIETPGHASHHHAILDTSEGTVYTGDALGVRLQDVERVRPATPPPEFDLEIAKTSIEKIRSLEPERVVFTHFGPAEEVDALCDVAIEELDRWARFVEEARRETTDVDEAARLVRTAVENDFAGGLAPGDVERLEQTTSYWMNTWGYMRYFDKQEQS